MDEVSKRVKKIIRGTGSYDNVKFGNTVSITGDGGKAWNYNGPAYKKMAPLLMTYIPYAASLKELESQKEFMAPTVFNRAKKKIQYAYIKSYYETRLRELDMNLFLDELEQRFGVDIIFLCHEPVTEFCHRRVLADFIELTTGVYIPELKVLSEDDIILKRPISYQSELKRVMKLNNDPRGVKR